MVITINEAKKSSVIRISKELAVLYKSWNHDPVYVLSELCGHADLRNCQQISSIPSLSGTKVELDVGEDVYQQLVGYFGKGVDSAAEILLWSNFFLGQQL